jgi:hypothetical protein
MVPKEHLQSSNLQMALKTKMEEHDENNPPITTPDEQKRIEHIARLIKNKTKTVDISKKRCNSLFR